MSERDDKKNQDGKALIARNRLSASLTGEDFGHLKDFFVDDREAEEIRLRSYSRNDPDRALLSRTGAGSVIDNDYLSFMLGNEEYAVPITSLREIVRPLPLADVPRTPDYVLGVMTLRGAVMPVLDLRIRLGLTITGASRASRILVMETRDGPAGIWADRVCEVVRIGDIPLEQPPSALGSDGDFLEGIIRREGRMLIVLNPETSLKVEAMDISRSIKG